MNEAATYTLTIAHQANDSAENYPTRDEAIAALEGYLREFWLYHTVDGRPTERLTVGDLFEDGASVGYWTIAAA